MDINCSADVVNNTLENVVESLCSLTLSILGGNGIFSVILDSQVQRTTTTVTVQLTGLVDGKHQVIWINNSCFLVKTLDGSTPALPTSISISVSTVN